MLNTVAPADRARLSPLFDGFPGLHGLIDSVLEGVLGNAWSDDPLQPRIARLELDFQLLAGDPNSAPAADTIAAIPSGEHLAVPESWADLVMDARETLQTYERFDCPPPKRWDRGHLTLFQELPDDLVIERITAKTVPAFARLADSLVYNFDSHEHFLERGVGFGIRHQDRFVAGCSSFAMSSRSLEFEVQTHPDYQRRGLALATCARMIEHCLEHGLVPCWDAAHDGSARLAERLGFEERRPYTAYRLQ